MSLFLSQQNMPFQIVSKFLRYFAPGTETPPAEWAQTHARDICPADILFVLDPIFSPWGDSASGIGVADGDSFKIAQSLFVFKFDVGGVQAYSVTHELYELQSVTAFLEKQARLACDQSAGFYYALVRPIVTPAGEQLQLLNQLDSFGVSGARSAESGGPDLPRSFFEAIAYPLESAHGQILDAGGLGYSLFCDKEPVAGSAVPDLRSYLAPVAMDEGRGEESASAAGTQARPPVSTDPGATGGSIPRLPSFFSQMKPGIQTPSEPARMPAATPSPTASASASTVPAPPAIKLPQPPKRPGGAPGRPVSPGGIALPAPPRSGAGAVPPLPSSPVSGETTADLSGIHSILSAPEQPASTSPAAQSPPQPPTNPIAEPRSAMKSPIKLPPAIKGPSSRPAATSMSAQNSSASVAPVGSAGVADPKSEPFKTTRSSSVAIPHPVPSVRSGTVPPVPGSQPVEPVTSQSPQPEAVITAPIPAINAAAPTMPSSPPKIPGSPLPAAISASASTPLKNPAASESAKSAPAAPPVKPTAASEPARQTPPTKPPIVAESLTPPVAETPKASPVVEATTVLPDKAVPPEPALPDLVSLLEAAAAPKYSSTSGRDEADHSLSATSRAAEEQASVVGAGIVDGIAVSTDGPVAAATGAETARAQDDERPLKEPAPVKSGVAGLVAKLEHQAAKASARLEAQVEEIQNQLNEELTRLLGEVSAGEQRGLQNADRLRSTLTGRMDSAAEEVKEGTADATNAGAENIKKHLQTGIDALDEKREFLRTSLAESFDEIRNRAERIAKGFEEEINGKSQLAQNDLKELRKSLNSQFDEVQDRYELALQSAFDGFRDRTEAANKSIVSAIETRYSFLQAELLELKGRSTAELDQAKEQMLNRLTKQFEVAEAELGKLQATLLSENIMPRLKQHREELRVVTSEFQRKLTEDLESKGATKVLEFDPVLQEKKQKLSDLLQETTSVKDSMQDQLGQRLAAICTALVQFVDENIAQAKSAYKSTEEQLTEIDRSVRGLADPASIESDTRLRQERNEVLSSIGEATEKCKNDVLNTLRTSVAGLEESGKQLQEELISSMEEDAYMVRRASEQALVAIKEELRASFVAIQSAQDERMPM